MSGTNSTTVGNVVSTALMDIPLDQLLDDLARDLHQRPVVAERYGLSLAEMHSLISRPAVLRLYRQRKAVWESSANLDDRIRAYAQIALIEKMPDLVQMMTDKSEHPQVRVEATKSISRAAGDPGAGRAGQGGPGSGAPFAVNIYFGERAETISTMTVEHAPE